MSSYVKETKHPETGQWMMAAWIDDRLGPHHYGVEFPDGTKIDPWEVPLETRENEYDPINTALERIAALQAAHFHGDLHEMFVFYAPTGKLDAKGLIAVLIDAGIGNALTHNLYAKEAIAAADTDGDGLVSEDELRAAILKHAGKTQ